MRPARRAMSVAAAVVIAASLAACADPDTGGGSAGPASGDEGDSPASDGTTGAPSSPVDLTSLEPVPEIAALVPEGIAERGVLRVGSDTSYAPAEFLDADGHTPVGYDVDLAQALAALMGLDGAEVQTAEFPTIIPALGTRYDLGISSYTITPERLEQVNMVSYLSVGSMYAVREGNPTDFDPDDPCGAVLGVQNGTVQFDLAHELADSCATSGAPDLQVMPLDLQTDVSTKVIGGQYDATVADTTVLAYAVQQSGGRLELVGDEFGAAPQGIAVAKDDDQLTAAVQAGLQELMDQGILTRILAAYGADDVGLNQAEINPEVGP